MVSSNIIKTVVIDEDVFHTSGSSVSINLEVLNNDNLPLSGCVSVETSIIKTFPENPQLNDCGCPTDECKEGSLKIKINKIKEQRDCSIEAFVLDTNGLVLFTVNGNQTYYIPSECCVNLGYTPEIDEKGIYVCRWGTEPNICDGYSELARADGYVIFSDPDGVTVDEVPSSECCPVDTVPEYQLSGLYKCAIPVQSDVCEFFRLNNIEQINSSGQVTFWNNDGTVIQTTETPECCTNIGFDAVIYQNTPGLYECIQRCIPYSNYFIDRETGYIIFIGMDGQPFDIMPHSTCCPFGTMPELVGNSDTDISVKCVSNNNDNGNTGNSDACPTKQNMRTLVFPFTPTLIATGYAIGSGARVSAVVNGNKIICSFSLTDPSESGTVVVAYRVGSGQVNHTAWFLQPSDGAPHGGACASGTPSSAYYTLEFY